MKTITTTFLKSTSITLASLLALPVLALAQGGDLEPPGAPEPTMRTLDEVEPRTPISELPSEIEEPGSYYLTENLTSEEGGITIKANQVTLDLNGYKLLGSGDDSGDGILVEPLLVFNPITEETSDAPRRDIVIRNGHVSSWSENGINAEWAENSRFEGLSVSNNDADGLETGESCVVENVVASLNGDHGVVSPKSTVKTVTAKNNTGVGISADGGNVTNSAASDNSGSGIIAENGSVSDSTAHDNGGVEIQAFDGSVSHSVATSNSETGIRSPGGTVANSHASDNEELGINADRGAVTNSQANDNGETGINAIGGSVTHSVATSNGEIGINVYGLIVIGFSPETISGSVTHSVANQNEGTGIYASGGVVAFSRAGLNEDGDIIAAEQTGNWSED
ncbi:MAG: right-handed parallel beta-helix repeat-containing protein [Opitutales bacterium]|nr:right-handed parallel beta-helix repeat-containing protein [Opitutales bacterium]